MSSMRIGGLASGMDIDSIIADLMKAERIPLDKMEQSRQRLEWQQEDYRSINKQLNTFRESLFELKLQRTFNVKRAVSSNDSIVQVTAAGNALEGTSNISVSQLAAGAFKTSSAKLGINIEGTTLSTQLSSLAGLTEPITVKINGEDITVDPDSDSIYDLVEAINQKSGKTGVQASYDILLDRFFLSTTGTGSEAKISLVGSSGLFTALKIDTTEVAGQDAKITLNGADFSMASNEFTINGITYNLKGVSPTDANNHPVSTAVSVETDTDQIFKTIMDFVDLYNETIDKINTKVNEKYYRDYPPLTDAQREQLDEDQIEKWTEKAKSGLLKNDSMLTGIVSSFRTSIYCNVTGLPEKYDSLADIGFTTGTYLERGKIHVNEDDLREAIEADPEAIKKLFTATSDDGNDDNEGIAARLYNDVLKGISNLTEKAGMESDFSLVDNSLIGERLKDMDERIEAFEDRLEDVEDRYWRQFSAMEEAINQMNSQSMWLSSYLGNQQG